MTYEVAMPIIRGWQVVEVKANSEEEAKELVAQGEYDQSQYDEVEVDTDSNNWEVSEE